MPPAPPRVTITEIARSLGIHHSTVSRALRSDPAIRAETRHRIRDAAAAMGYQPNPRLREMMKQVRNEHPRAKNESLAIVMPPQSSLACQTQVLSDIVAGAKGAAKASGFECEVFHLDASLTAEKLSRVLNHRSTRGVILLPSDAPGPAIDLAGSDRAVVVVGADAHPHVVAHRVCFDAFRGMGRLLERLHAEGHRRFSLRLTGSPFRCTEKAYLAAASNFAVTHENVTIQCPESNDSPAEEGTRCEVLITDCPQTAVRLSSAVPGRQLASIGPNLPGQRGWRVDFARIGAAAMAVLVQQLDRHCYGPPTHPETTLLSGEWCP